MARGGTFSVARGEEKLSGSNQQRSEQEILSTLRISDFGRRAREKGLEVDDKKLVVCIVYRKDYCQKEIHYSQQ